MNQKRLEIFSSGGCGDALIVGLKIQEATKSYHPSNITWRHFEKHECHKKPIEDIMKQFVSNSECIICEGPEQEAQEDCKKNNGTYINTKIREVVHPFLKKPIGGKGFFHPKIIGLKNYIVVQAQAGRMHDGTRREIGPEVINKLLKDTGKDVVILGPEKAIFSTLEPSRVVNMTGKTESILDALEIINDCSLFVGQDGIMAYYAAMIKKKTIIFYHMPNLPDHYWHGGWNNAIAYVGNNHISKLPQDVYLQNFYMS